MRTHPFDCSNKFNSRKKVTIEIYNDDPSGARGYTLHHKLNKFESRRITDYFGAGDDQIEMLLSRRQLRDFYERGKYTFTVSAGVLFEEFNYMA